MMHASAMKTKLSSDAVGPARFGPSCRTRTNHFSYCHYCNRVADLNPAKLTQLSVRLQ